MKMMFRICGAVSVGISLLAASSALADGGYGGGHGGGGYGGRQRQLFFPSGDNYNSPVGGGLVGERSPGWWSGASPTGGTQPAREW